MPRLGGSRGRDTISTLFPAVTAVFFMKRKKRKCPDRVTVMSSFVFSVTFQLGTNNIRRTHSPWFRAMRMDAVNAVNVCFAAVGLVMFGICLGLLNESSLPYTVTGTWMSGFLACFAAEPLVTGLVLPVSSASRGCACCPRYPYSLTVAGISVFLSLGWFVGGRYDGGLWASTILLLVGFQYGMEKRGLTESSVEAGEACATRQSNVADQSTESFGKLSDQLQDPAEKGALAAPGASGRIASFALNFWRCVVLVLYFFLLGGCWLQAIGYRAHPPDGVFVTISVGDVTQSILTNCKGPRSDVTPTLFLEVGGGDTL